MSKINVQFITVPGTTGFTVGEEVYITSATEVVGNDKAYSIKEGTEDRAYAVSSQVGKIALNQGAITGEEMHDMIPKDQRSEPIKGKVSEMLNNGIIVEVDMLQFKVSTGVQTSRKFELKVSGSVRNYQAKSAVIKAFKNGQEVQVKLTEGEEKDNGILLTYAGMETDRRGNPAKAGVIRPIGNDNLDGLKELIANMKEVTGTVISAEDSSYTLLVKVDQDVVEAISKGQPIPDVEDVKERLIQEGIATAETLDEVIAYLQKNGVPTKKIRKVLETYKKYEEEDAAYIPSKPETEFVDEGGFVRRSVNYVLAGPTNPVRFTGEAGTGKNLLITTLAWVFQRPLFEKAVNAELDKFDRATR